MNQKTTKRQALGTSLSALMRTSATTQLDRRSILIDRLRAENEDLRAEVERLEQLVSIDPRTAYVAGKINYREYQRQTKP
jgi:hypothetical protein